LSCEIEATDRFQRDLIARTLAEANHNWAAVARVLGLHRSNLHRLAARLGLR
jgi:anaerobic nitric oxide reductase transcription regulator